MLLDHRSAGDTVVAMTGSATSSLSRAAVRPRPLARRAQPAWMRTYTRSLVAFETVAAAIAGGAVVVGHSAWGNPSDPLLWSAVALVLGWPALLGATDAY